MKETQENSFLGGINQVPSWMVVFWVAVAAQGWCAHSGSHLLDFPSFILFILNIQAQNQKLLGIVWVFLGLFS